MIGSRVAVGDAQEDFGGGIDVAQAPGQLVPNHRQWDVGKGHGQILQQHLTLFPFPYRPILLLIVVVVVFIVVLGKEKLEGKDKDDRAWG